MVLCSATGGSLPHRTGARSAGRVRETLAEALVSWRGPATSKRGRAPLPDRAREFQRLSSALTIGIDAEP
jgi:hypothetical protein